MRAGVVYPKTIVIGNQEYKVGRRIPFVLTAERIFASLEGRSFEAGDFNTGQQYPFEVDTIIPRAVKLANGQPTADPAPSIYKFFSFGIKMLGLTQEFETDLRIADGLLEANKRVWYVAPLTVMNQQAFKLRAQNLISDGSSMRISMSFRGNILILTPTKTGGV